VCFRILKKSTTLEVATPDGTVIVNLRSGFPAPYKCGVNVELQTQQKVWRPSLFSVTFYTIYCF
jgi:hypothetical protein